MGGFFAAPDPGLPAELWFFPGSRIAWGGMEICQAPPLDIALIHATKDPCHRVAVGYTAKALPRDHPEYLFARDGRHLYLNIIDPPLPLFQPQTFTAATAFALEHMERGIDIVIHCNMGVSRSPSIAMLILARAGLLPDDSYQHADVVFREKLKGGPKEGFYHPGVGISQFLREHWSEVIE